MSDRDERPLRASLDLDAWEPQAPPPDFAERVLGRIQADKPAATPAAAAGVNEKEKRSRFTRVAAGTLATLALAAGVLLAVDRAPAKGDAIAKDRTEVDIGSRARAVLEPGAHVAWNGDDVTQDTGDVFYRVEPGAKFRVHTPAGDVEVKGTCFTVKVHGDDMNKRDAKSAAVGAAVTALAFVAVYEGKVAVSQAATHVDVAAGESATLGPDGAVKSGDIASGEGSFRDRVESDPTNAANQNLVGQVQEYRHRLELLAAQKTEVEKKLEATEKKLAATTDGSVRTRNEYDLDQDDWRELAKKGEVKYRSPCLRTDRFDFPADKLQKLGLAPQDGAVLKDAYQKSYQRVWSTVRPLCIAALGTSEQIVDRIGPEQCIHLVYDLAQKDNPSATAEAHTEVAEIRAGLRAEPPVEKQHPVMKMFLLLTSLNQQFEADLAKSLGPEEAHRLAYSDDNMCAWTSRWSGGTKRDAEK